MNAQFGLLLERLFFKRVVNDIRAAMGIFQYGYQYRCEYHALVFREIAASRIALGPGMVALLGDLVGAFQRLGASSSLCWLLYQRTWLARR